jgi:hypothetical protein
MQILIHKIQHYYIIELRSFGKLKYNESIRTGIYEQEREYLTDNAYYCLQIFKINDKEIYILSC